MDQQRQGSKSGSPGAISWPALALCVLAAVAVHGQSAGFGFTGTDDKVLLVDDAAFLQDAGNISRAFVRPFFPLSVKGEVYYRPLVTTTFILDAQWNDVVARPYHVTNVLFHAIAAGLFLVFLRHLGFSQARAAVGACIFAVHPALTAAVAWIPGRCDLLLGIGFLGSAIGVLRMARGGRGGLALGIFGLAIGLFSKEAALAIPVVLALLLAIVPSGPHVLRDWRLWLGWAAVTGSWLVLRSSLEMHAPAGGDRFGVFLAHLPVLLMHLGKLLVPHGLAVLASARDTGWEIGAGALAAFVVLGALVTNLRLYLWGLGCFLGFVLPTLPVSDFLILENRLYVPAMGVLVALVVAAGDCVARWPRLRPVVAVATALVLLGLSAITVRYGASFRDSNAFTEAAIRTSPHLALAHLNRGIVFHQEGRASDAESEYETALGLDPGVPVTQNNLGLILMSRGDLAGAERLFRNELQINPSYDKAHFNLGLALARQGRVPEAAASWRETLRLNPGNSDARANLDHAESAYGAPVASPAMLEGVPTDVLVTLYEEALGREPTNEAIRRAYREMCEKRRVTCPSAADGR